MADYTREELEQMLMEKHEEDMQQEEAEFTSSNWYKLRQELRGVRKSSDYEMVSHLTTGSFNVKFNATHTIFTAEYVALVNGSDYNMTSNPTARRNIDNKAQYHTELLANNLTSSNWNPFMNTIGFYQDDEKYPTMVARYSQPIKIRNDMNLIFKVRIDF